MSKADASSRSLRLAARILSMIGSFLNIIGWFAHDPFLMQGAGVVFSFACALWWTRDWIEED